MKYFLNFIFLFFTISVFGGCKKEDTAPDGPLQVTQPQTPQDSTLAGTPQNPPGTNPTTGNPTSPVKATIIYVVRHAEKGTNSATDPDLSAAGQARAIALKDTLAKVPVKAIYATPFKRTRQTGQPTATAKNLTLQEYDPMNAAAIAAKVLKDNKYQAVLIVGHSNTVLDIVEAFQVPRPTVQITDSDYKYLFKVTLPENGSSKVEVLQYGN